jgi:FAD dependent oxidoreductase
MTDGTRGTWGCAINPETAWEQRWRAYPPAPRPSRVVVVGGGPAGLEAARVAARRGHRVVLFERQDRVGGQLNLWAALPDREIFATTPEWYERRLRQHGVDVRLNTEATADLILAEEPGAILIGTGSRYIRTGETGYFKRPVPGWDQDFVVTPEQVFSIGDALSPRGLTAAIQDGHRFARTVGEPDAPRTFTDLYFAPVDFSTFQRPASVLLAE